MEGAAAHARLVEGVQVGTGLDQDAGSLEKKSFLKYLRNDMFIKVISVKPFACMENFALILLILGLCKWDVTL